MADCGAFISEQYKALREKNGEMLDAMLADIELMRKDSVSPDSLKKKINDYLKDTSENLLENQMIKIADVAKMADLTDRVFSHPKGPANGLLDVLTPSFVMGKNVGINVETIKSNLYTNSLNYLQYNLSDAQIKIMRDGTMDLDIMRARLDPKADVPQAAKDIAQVIGGLKNLEHGNFEKVGINKGFQDNYLLNQGIFWTKENIERLGPDAGFSSLKQLFREAYDLEASFKYMPADQIDGYIEDLARGVIDKALDAQAVDFQKLNLGPDVLKGKVIRRNLQPRKLVLKPDGFAKMWQAMMPPEARLLDSLVNESNRMATDVATYKVLGSNGFSSVQTLVTKVARKMQADGVPDAEIDAFRNGKVSGVQNWENVLRILDGSTDKAVDANIAAAQEIYSAVTMARLLGGSTLSAVTDLANSASMLSATTGSSYLGNIGKMLVGSGEAYVKAFSGFLPGGKSVSRNDAAKMFLFPVQGMLSRSLADIRASQVQGPIARTVAKSAATIQAAHSKINPISVQQQLHSEMAGKLYAGMLAQQKDLSFSELDFEFRENFQRVGITENDWDLLRSTAKQVNLDGDDFTIISGRHIKSAGDEAIKASFEKNKAALGDRYSVLTPKQYVGDMETKMDLLYSLLIQDAVPQPGARQRAVLGQGQRKGTPSGAFFQAFSMLKSFSVKMLDVNRRVMNSGEGGSKNYKLLTAHVMGLYGMGYAVQVLKALKNNETPPDPTVPSSHLSAMIQGGVGGPVADFLLSQASRGSFKGAVVGLIGPAASDLETLGTLAMKTATGDLSSKDASTALNYIPGNNLWYLNAALKYSVLDELKEEMNPGHSRRMRKRLEERQGMLWDQGQLVE